MDRAAFGGQPDQQGRLQDQAAALDQSTLEEFDSVLDEAALGSEAGADLDRFLGCHWALWR